MTDFNFNESIALIKEFLLTLQNRICQFVEQEDEQQKFIEERWQHQEGGGGITRVLADGKVIEKAGVNFSHVQGNKLPSAATQRKPELANAPFEALGVSTVIHPMNPYIPTSHFNVRFIIAATSPAIWWFGGGFDLTPYYPFIEDCQHWHRMAKEACDPFGAEVYSTYKAWADRYFYLKHRHEPRGIGGIFYDDLNEWGFIKCFAFMQRVAEYYLKAYQPIVQQRKQQTFTAKERAFQLYRRGRYVEFNLLYDRGTLFGLQSGGRTESILTSLPPLVKFQYNPTFKLGSPEKNLYEMFLQQKEWI